MHTRAKCERLSSTCDHHAPVDLNLLSLFFTSRIEKFVRRRNICDKKGHIKLSDNVKFGKETVEKLA